ncbi:hypothetical protein SUSAZ_08910 [Sulfolobus acidocaldarius SUSAZ]|nr:hypothetical protein SUSAZ_08910 [Sulfolobus acidocaldarius SUSAZ]
MKSFKEEQAMRKYIVQSLVIIFIGIELLTSLISFGVWEMIGIDIAIVLSISILYVCVLGGIIYLLYKVSLLRKPMKDGHLGLETIDDDKYWDWRDLLL